MAFQTKINGVESVSKMLKSPVRKVCFMHCVTHFVSLSHKRWMEASLFGEGSLDISSYLIIYISLTSAKGMTRIHKVQSGMAAGAPFSLCEHLGKAAAAT